MKRERARSCCAQVHNSDESINEDFDEISCSVVNKAASADLDIYMYLDNSGVGWSWWLESTQTALEVGL